MTKCKMCRLWNRTLAIRPKCLKKMALWQAHKRAPLSDADRSVLRYRENRAGERVGKRLVGLIDFYPAIDMSAMGFAADWRNMKPWRSL